MSTQWAAQFLVAAELERRGYVVTFTMGHATPVADLMVGHESGEQFWVDVKGLGKPNSWFGKPKPARSKLFYVLVLVGRERAADRFFILTQAEWNRLIEDYEKGHPTQKKSGGFGWRDPHGHENPWAKMPGWDDPGRA